MAGLSILPVKSLTVDCLHLMYKVVIEYKNKKAMAIIT